MVVEPAVFRGERGFDQIVGQLVHWVGIVGPNAAATDFGAELVEKDHGQIFGLVELAGGRGIESRQREPYHQHGANRYEGQRVRDDFDKKPFEAADMKQRHEVLEAPVSRRQRTPEFIDSAVEPRVGLEHAALFDTLLFVVKRILHG